MVYGKESTTNAKCVQPTDWVQWYFFWQESCFVFVCTTTHSKLNESRKQKKFKKIKKANLEFVTWFSSFLLIINSFALLNHSPCLFFSCKRIHYNSVTHCQQYLRSGLLFLIYCAMMSFDLLFCQKKIQINLFWHCLKDSMHYTECISEWCILSVLCK